MNSSGISPETLMTDSPPADALGLASSLTTPPDEAKPRIGHLRLLLLSAFWFGSASFSSAMTVLILADRVNLMVAESSRSIVVGAILSVGGLVSGIVQPIAGAKSDRIGTRWGRRTPFLVVGTAVTLAFMVLLAVGGHFRVLWVFAIAYVLAVSELAASSGPFYAILPDMVPPQQFGVASGYMGLMDMLGTTFGAAVMGLIAAALVHSFGGFYLPVLAILAVALVLGLVVSLLAVREKACVPHAPVTHSSMRARLASVWHDIRGPFISRDFFWVFWTRFLMMAGLASVRGFLQYWVEDVVQKPYNVLGWVLPDAKAATSMFLLPLLVGATVAALLAGALSDRFGRKLLVYLAGAVQAATAIGMILLPNMNAVVVLGLFFGLGYGAYQSVDFALAADVLPDPATSAKDLGVWSISSTLASIFAPLVAGLVLDTFKAVGMAHFGTPRLGYTIMLSCACAMFVLSTVLVSRIKTDGGRMHAPVPLTAFVPRESDETELVGSPTTDCELELMADEGDSRKIK